MSEDTKEIELETEEQVSEEKEKVIFNRPRLHRELRGQRVSGTHHMDHKTRNTK